MAPTPVPTQDATPDERAHTTQDPNKTFLTPNLNDPGNFINNITFTTNSMDFDTCLSPMMAKELQQLRKMISSAPRVVQPVPKYPLGATGSPYSFQR